MILGKEDCAAYRKRVPPARRKLGVAGMFNTGTNLLDTQMTKNIRMPSALAHLWQVPWGKHRMADVKWNHTAASFENADKENVLPVVMIRDPFAWLQSMCGHAYAAVWRHGKHHCPNLLPNEVDLQKFPRLKKDDAIPVMINFDKHSQNRYNSLVHLWSEWYAQYLEVDYPILMGKLTVFFLRKVKESLLI